MPSMSAPAVAASLASLTVVMPHILTFGEGAVSLTRLTVVGWRKGLSSSTLLQHCLGYIWKMDFTVHVEDVYHSTCDLCNWWTCAEY